MWKFYRDTFFALLVTSTLSFAQTDRTAFSEEKAVVPSNNSETSASEQQVEPANSVPGTAEETAKDEIVNNTTAEEIVENAPTGEAIESTSAEPPVENIPTNKPKEELTEEKIPDEIASMDSTTADVPFDSSWDISGNVSIQGAFHYVRTRDNDEDTTIVNNEVILKGERFKNYFQVPGFSANTNAYVRAESPDGRSFEFIGDMSNDKWNHILLNQVTFNYEDQYSHVSLGDFSKTAGTLYMDGIPVFGIDYSLAFLKNSFDMPLVQLNAFGGENTRSLVPGERHPYIYNDYIDEGEAVAQRMVYGGSLKIAPHKFYNVSIGGLYSKDDIESPILRKGTEKSTLTSEPMLKALALYGEANAYLPDYHLNASLQASLGRADTTNVSRERAINQTFYDAGLTPSSKLRNLMQNEDAIDNLSFEELQEIFGTGRSLSKTQMQETLHTIIKRANEAPLAVEEKDNSKRKFGLDWKNQNLALEADFNWNYKRTSVSTYAKYIGKDYFSPGSPDQLGNSRELGINVTREFASLWDLSLDYNLFIENAAHGDKTNILGLGEGTHTGLFPDIHGDWYERHERDVDRTRYTQNANIGNTIRLSKNFKVLVGYRFEYQKQYRPYRLNADYSTETAIFMDDWFNPREGYNTTSIKSPDSGYVLVDKERWDTYTRLSGLSFIASRFQERLYRHSWNAGVIFKKSNTNIKATGRWTYRIDASRFLNDTLIEHIHLSNSSWAKLGYYFGNSNYFEQTYSISASTMREDIHNVFSVTPRFKSYKRDDMDETELSIMDEAEFPVVKDFLSLVGNGEFRYLNTQWTENDNEKAENEIDIIGNIGVQLKHTEHFTSEWLVGGAFYYRPDYLYNDYKDFYCGFNVSYAF